MNQPIRFGILGLVHDHVWGNLEVLKTLDAGKLVAVADPNQPLLDKVKAEHDCATYTDYDAMLDNEELDAVFICTDNAKGVELTIDAAERGLHVMVEKPMATTQEGAQRMLDAVEKAGTRMMINWPVAWRPQVQEAMRMALNKEFGDIWQITHRTGHGGIYVECTPYFREWIVDKERNGGGALMDVCSYGINIAQLLLGRPSSVTAVAGNLIEKELKVEDNAVVVMSYPNAIATAEGAWGQKGKPLNGYMATIWCAEGSITFGPGAGGRIWTTSGDKPEYVEVTPPELEPHMANGVAHFIWALSSDEAFYPLCRPENCRNTHEIIDAAFLAVETHKEVTLS